MINIQDIADWDLNSNMIILKEKGGNAGQLELLYLNSNMIILKGRAKQRDIKNSRI